MRARHTICGSNKGRASDLPPSPSSLLSLRNFRHKGVVCTHMAHVWVLVFPCCMGFCSGRKWDRPGDLRAISRISS